MKRMSYIKKAAKKAKISTEMAKQAILIDKEKNKAQGGQ